MAQVLEILEQSSILDRILEIPNPKPNPKPNPNTKRNPNPKPNPNSIINRILEIPLNGDRLTLEKEANVYWLDPSLSSLDPIAGGLID